MTETWTKEKLMAEVEALARIAAQPEEKEHDVHFSARIEHLRGIYRSTPALFDPSLVKWIRRLAEVKPGRETPKAVLETIFGYASFRAGQEELIAAVLAGHDALGIMPTGAGKSLTYQIPARILPGTTLVISPLISLMKDQVDALTEFGMEATFINSSLDAEERRNRTAKLIAGQYDLVYIAPEGLDGALFDLLSHCKINLIAVDEAHCISQWGHDFRPAYRNLSNLKQHFGHVPVLALTATATDKVVDDIAQQMGMLNPFRYRGSFFRHNLHLYAYKKGNGRHTKQDILHLVQSRKGQSGIIYCLSRKGVEQTTSYLADHGVRVMPYHAGMPHERREEAQEMFRRDETEVIVATVAFGMGIDKPNVRYVIHRDMPKSIDGYYQEIGRAGRDGVGSDCILFYSWSEVMSYDRFFNGSRDEEMQNRTAEQTRAMFRLAEKESCRHEALVAYFGETISPCEKSCDHCLKRDLLKEIRPLPQKKTAKARPVPQWTASDDPSEDAASLALLDTLKTLRKKLADKKGVPAYLVFSDAVLLEMVTARPQDEDEMLQINGVGPKKLAAYASHFLPLLSNTDPNASPGWRR